MLIKQALVANTAAQQTHARKDHATHTRIATHTIVENEADNKERRAEKTKVVVHASESERSQRDEERAAKGGMAKRKTDIFA